MGAGSALLFRITWLVKAASFGRPARQNRHHAHAVVVAAALASRGQRGDRAEPVAAGDVELLPFALRGTAVGYQPVGMKPRTARLRRDEIDHRHGVVGAVGDVQSACRRRRTARALGELPRGACWNSRTLMVCDHAVGLRVDHGDRIAVGVGDVEAVARRGERHAARVQPHVDMAQHLFVRRVDHRHGAAGRNAGATVEHHRKFSVGHIVGAGPPAAPVAHVDLLPSAGTTVYG